MEKHEAPNHATPGAQPSFALSDATRKTPSSTEDVESHRALSVTSSEDHATSPPDTADLEAISTVSTRGPLYSIFTPSQRRFTVIMAATGAFFSAVSATIYFPALNVLAADFHVSSSLINLTLTSYMIFQGIAPMILGNFADSAGRRPAYIMCFIIYIGANIGLALCPSYTALIILRALQSAGSSSTISLGSGVVADLADASERGLWMGITTAGPNTAQAFGPVIGGLLAQFLGWRWIFWFLLIIASAYLIIYAIFVPETSRIVVGNGSIPPSGWNMSVLNFLALRRQRRQHTGQEEGNTNQTDVPVKRHIALPNPWSSIRLIGEKDIALLLIYNSMIFANWYVVVATTPTLFAAAYGFNELEIGLCFLPMGASGFVAPILNGKLLDWNFRRHANKLGLKIDRRRATDLTSFPLEKARTQALTPVMLVSVVVVLIYGWVMHVGVHLAVALVLQAFLGFSTTAAFSTISVLMVDLNSQSPATVIATNNLSRCWVGAGATAAIVPLINALGTGGAFTLTSGLLFLCTPISFILAKWGPGWRQERKERLQRRSERHEQRRSEKAQRKAQASSSGARQKN